MNALFPESRIDEFLLNLECLDRAGQHDAFMSEALETGGSFLSPNQSDSWSSHMHEITLHGITAYGDTEEEVMANWRKIARQRSTLIQTTATIGDAEPAAQVFHA